MADKSNSLSLQFKVLKYKQDLRNQFIEQHKSKARKEIMKSNQQEKFKQQRNAWSNAAPSSKHDDKYYSHPVSMFKDNPFCRNQQVQNVHFENIPTINIDQYLLTAIKFEQSGIGQQEVRRVISVELLINKFWLEKQDTSGQSAPKEFLTLKQQKILRILEKIAKILTQKEIMNVIQIYLFLLRKNLFNFLQYLISPLIQFLKKGFINSETDEIIYLIFKHLRTHNFKRPEYLGQLIHFSSIILANYLAGIYKQNHLKFVNIDTASQSEMVNQDQKCYLQLADIFTFFQQVVDFGNTFMPKGEINDIENIMENLLFSVRVIMKIYYCMKCAFQLSFLQLMIEIMYQIISLTKKHFENIHKKLLIIIVQFLKEERQRAAELLKLTLLDSYLSCLSSSQFAISQVISKIFQFYQKGQLDSMKSYEIQRKYDNLQRKMRQMEFED